MMSESDYPFEAVLWQDVTEPTPALLRRASGSESEAAINTESVEEFFRAALVTYEGAVEEDRQRTERFRRLVETLKTNLEDVQVYRIGSINIPVYIIGRTPSGHIAGISTRVVET